MQDFFRKHGVAVMTIRELFDFIVDQNIADESVDSYLEEVYIPSREFWVFPTYVKFPKIFRDNINLTA